VLTEKDIKAAISSLNGYFEYSRFFSYAPGGWIEEGGFVHQIEATTPVGVKVIQLQFEREFISRLNLPDGKITASSSSEFGLISEELERFGLIKVRADDWSEETRINHQSIFDTFVEIVGDQPVEALSRADINTYLDVLDTLPPNRKKVKTFRNLDATSASALNAEMGGKSISKNTKNNYIKRLSEPFQEFVIGKLFTYNYFTAAKGYSITKEEKLDARNPWSPEDIKIMIESDEAIKLLSKAKHQVSKPWALLICMFTGARIGELLSFHLR